MCRGRSGATGVTPWGKPGPIGVRYPKFSPWDGRSTVSHPTCDVPFPPRRTGRYRKGMISALPSYQGVRRSVWDPETSAQGRRHVPRGAPSRRKRLGDWAVLSRYLSLSRSLARLLAAARALSHWWRSGGAWKSWGGTFCESEWHEAK
jgi:hypothetical protein